MCDTSHYIKSICISLIANSRFSLKKRQQPLHSLVYFRKQFTLSPQETTLTLTSRSPGLISLPRRRRRHLSPPWLLTTASPRRHNIHPASSSHHRLPSPPRHRQLTTSSLLHNIQGRIPVPRSAHHHRRGQPPRRRNLLLGTALHLLRVCGHNQVASSSTTHTVDFIPI
jgi:hypothetical protein